ncbi:MAG TPA: hypothetical protein VFH18_09525 [Erysipelotrichaceae bacterium]|nr:hypothetical protein [Erysipelotrichaceae bacterium]
MKILSSLVGLLLFLAGIYLTYTVFNDFDSYETLMLGLYLAGSFVLLTLGTFLFLLPLALKPKNRKSEFDQLEQSNRTQTNPVKDLPVETQEDLDIEISELDAIKIIQDEPIFQEPLVVEPTLLEEVKPVQSNLTLTQEIKLNAYESEKSNNQDTQDFSQSTPFEIVELRVIGIDSWASQGIIRKLVDDSILELSQKSKSGINMTQVMFKQKLIGYIPRLDMNKVNDKLDQLIDVTPATVVRDGRKIEHFSVNLKFKLKEEAHE